MLTPAERAGFRGIIIVRNGLEGTTAFPLIRRTKILCSSSTGKQGYVRHEIEFDAASLLSQPITVEEKLVPPSLEINTKLVKTFKQQGKTDNPLFDSRIKVTCTGIHDAIKWIRQNWI